MKSTVIINLINHHTSIIINHCSTTVYRYTIFIFGRTKVPVTRFVYSPFFLIKESFTPILFFKEIKNCRCVLGNNIFNYLCFLNRKLKNDFNLFNCMFDEFKFQVVAKLFNTLNELRFSINILIKEFITNWSEAN